MRVTAIVNRRARRLQNGSPIFEAVLRVARANSMRLLETRSLSDLEAAAAEIAADPGDTVVLAGGDGSYMAGVTALRNAFANRQDRFQVDASSRRHERRPDSNCTESTKWTKYSESNGAKRSEQPAAALRTAPQPPTVKSHQIESGQIAWPKIALVPGGTVSTVARNWGYEGGGLLSIGDGAAAKYTDALLSAIVSGHTEVTARPTLLVRNHNGDAACVEHVGFIVGAGLVARFFEIYTNQGSGGYRSAASLVMRIFGGSLFGGALARRVLEPVPCQVEVDGVRAPFDRTSLVCASVVRDLGLHLHLLHRAGEERDRFHIVATSLGPSRLGPQLPRVLAGKPLIGTHVDALAERATLTMPKGAFVLDGELFTGDRIEIEAGPVIRVLSM